MMRVIDELQIRISLTKESMLERESVREGERGRREKKRKIEKGEGSYRGIDALGPIEFQWLIFAIS